MCSALLYKGEWAWEGDININIILRPDQCMGRVGVCPDHHRHHTTTPPHHHHTTTTTTQHNMLSKPPESRREAGGRPLARHLPRVFDCRVVASKEAYFYCVRASTPLYNHKTSLGQPVRTIHQLP